MATLMARPVEARVRIIPAHDYEPDEQWKESLRTRIKESLSIMVDQANKEFEDKLNSEVPAEETTAKIKEDHMKTMSGIRRIADEQYENEVERERQERRWAAGHQVDQGWSEAMIKEQQAILDNIRKEEKQDERSHPVRDSSASNLRPHSGDMHPASNIQNSIAEPIVPSLNQSSTYYPHSALRPDGGDYTGEYAPHSEHFKSVNVADHLERGGNSQGSAGRQEVRGSRRLSSNSTQNSGFAPDFERPDFSHPQQPISGEFLWRQESLMSTGRARPSAPLPSRTETHDLPEQIDEKSWNEMEAVAAAEAPWFELIRAQGRDRERTSQYGMESRHITGRVEERPIMTAAGPHMSSELPETQPIVPPHIAGSRSIVNQRSFTSDAGYRPQSSPTSRGRNDYTRMADEGYRKPNVSVSVKDPPHWHPSESLSQLPHSPSPVDTRSKPFQSNISASKPIPNQKSFVEDNDVGQPNVGTRGWSGPSISPQESRFDFPISRSPNDIAGSRRRSGLSTQPSTQDLGRNGDDLPRSFQPNAPPSKPILVKRPSVSDDPWYVQQGSPSSRSRHGPQRNFEDSRYNDSPVGRSPPEHNLPRKPSSIRSQSSLRDIRHVQAAYRRRDPDPDLDEESDDDYETQDEANPYVEMARMKDAEARRLEEEALRQVTEASRQAEEARQRAEEVKRMEEEAKRKAEEARRKEEAARLKEEEIRKREEEVRRREEELQRKEQEVKLEEFRIREEKIKLSAERKRQDSFGGSSDGSSPNVSVPPSSPWSAGLHRNGSTSSNTSTDRTSTTSPTKGSSSPWSSATSATTNASTSSNRSSTAGTSWTSSNRTSTPASSANRTSAGFATGAMPATGASRNSGTPKAPNPGTSPHSASAFSEAEWARRQEEQAKKQQEQFRKEQERLENERQAKMSKTLTKEDVIQLFAIHERQWAVIASAEELGWNSFPWPVFKKPSNPDEMTTVAISAYVLSHHHPGDKSDKDRIKEHIRRWHPDRFETKLLPKVKEEERDKVKQGGGVVARGLNELLTRSNVNNVFS